MASRKSAKSKGYRRQQVKKPYLTKRDIIITCAIVAALILVVVLFNIFYSDGSLKLVDGAPQVEGENSLLCSDSTTSTKKYFKVGQVHDVEGWTLTGSPSETDANIITYAFAPEGEPAGAVDSVIVSGVNAEASTFASQMASMYSGAQGYNVSGPQTATVGDANVVWFSLKTDPVAIRAAIEAAKQAQAELAAPETEAEAEPEAEEAAETEAAPETEETAETEEAAETEAAPETEETAETEETETEAEDAEAEAEEDDGYDQIMYVLVSSGSRSIALNLLNEADSEADYVDDEQLLAELEPFIPALTYETK